MALTNLQVDTLLREYDRRQIRDRADQEERIRQALEQVPGLAQAEQAVSDLSVERARAMLQGDTGTAERLAKQLADVKETKAALLADAGLPADQMEMRYECPLCRDTGYVNGQKCRCFQKAIVDMLFRQDSVRERMREENFGTFDLDYFDREERNPVSGLTPYENMMQIRQESLRFVEEFIPGRENLLLMGKAGTGKTFLSHCIAGALMEKGFSVIYLSANSFFESLADHTFGRGGGEETYRYILDSDLLIIDDLGTEMNSSFVSSQLFFCVNERAQRERSTVISTNLTLNQIRDAYSERVSSRILENYRIFTLYNPDIRILKRTAR